MSITLQSLSLATSTLIEGISVTIVGMLTVFSVLLLIAISITIFSKLITQSAAAKENKTAKPQETVVAPAPVETVTAPANNVNDEELVAVITVAIANSINVATDSLVVKSIRRV